MRHPVILMLLLLTWGLHAGEQTPFERAIDGFRSPDAEVRDRSSALAVARSRKLLAPLIEAMEDPDPEVRRRARNAILALVPGQKLELPAKIRSWHPMKATGAPDALPNQDHPNAWASKTGNMGVQWLELVYSKSARVHTIRIFEVNSAGAVSRVDLYDAAGRRRTVWLGVDPTPKPGVFDLKIPLTPYKVKRVRIFLDTDRKPGWNEIDAVEIVGPGGRAWAVSATASSTYASDG